MGSLKLEYLDKANLRLEKCTGKRRGMFVLKQGDKTVCLDGLGQFFSKRAAKHFSIVNGVPIVDTAGQPVR